MMSSGMLDTYLIAQALGLPWNTWTMIGIGAVELLLGLLFIASCGIFTIWLDSK